MIDGGGWLNDTVDYSASSEGVVVFLNRGDSDAGTGSGGDAEGDLIFRTENAIGTAFGDEFWGSDGANTFHAGDGNDTLNGRGGADSVFGEGGDDLIVHGYGGGRLFDGGTGSDTLRLAGNTGNDLRDETVVSIENIEVGLNTGRNGGIRFNADQFPVLTSIASLNAANSVFVDVRTGTETLIDFSAEAVEIRGFDDPGDEFRFFGDADAETFKGTGIRDEIYAGAGDDTVEGNGGNDVIEGQDGNDIVDGGDGDDTVSGQNGDDVVQGGAGNDRVSGDAGNDTLDGGAGDDVLSGGDGNDVLSDDAGTNTLDGGRGDDLFLGDGGANAMAGGAGTDRVDYSASHAGVTFTLNDSAAAGSGGQAEGDTFRDIEDAVGSAFADGITGSGGVNVILAGDGDDTIDGQGGNDELSGGDGADVIIGGDGLDRIEGGAGDDVLTGGTGSDTFVFGGGGDDVVTDMEGIDRIDLSSYGDLDSFGDLGIAYLEDGAARIDLGNGSITLQGLDFELEAVHFLFG